MSGRSLPPQCVHCRAELQSTDEEICVGCLEAQRAFYEPEDNGDYDEPTGSCDKCGCNLYADDDYDGLCDQCAWLAEQG